MAQGRKPGVSYRASSPVYELFIVVRSADGGTTVDLSYLTHAKGDEPLQGHYWKIRSESPRQATSLGHLGNLAVWALRQATAGRWTKLR